MYSLGRILGILANQHKNGKLILEMKQLESEHHVLCYTMFHPWPPPPILAGPDVWDKENALDQQHKNLWFACLVVWKQHQTVVSWWFTMVETKNKHPKQAQATYATF